MFESVKKGMANCVELAKLCKEYVVYLKEEYKDYKADEARWAQRDAEIERIVREDVVFDEKTKKYHFETSAEHNGISKTFSCESEFKDVCQNRARLCLLEADQYEMFGDNSSEETAKTLNKVQN